MLFLGKKEKSMIDEKLVKQISYAVYVAKGNRDVKLFCNAMRMSNHEPILDLLKRNIKELPDRKLLQLISNNSEGRITKKHLYDICGYSESDPEEDQTWKNFNPERGSVYLGDLGYFNSGSEIGSTRPLLVIQNDKGNRFSTTTIIIPISSKCRFTSKIHIPLKKDLGFKMDCELQIEQIRTISTQRLFVNGGVPYKITKLPNYKMKEVENGLKLSLGFESLMFEEGRVFEMVEHIRTLQSMNKRTPNIIKIIDQKFNELKDYCSMHGKNLKLVMQEYDRINGYVSQVV